MSCLLRRVILSSIKGYRYILDVDWYISPRARGFLSAERLNEAELNEGNTFQEAVLAVKHSNLSSF